MTASQDYVVSTLNYLADSERNPKSYIDRPAAGTGVRRPEQVQHDIRIRDSRPFIDDLSLDAQGFELVSHRSRVKNFYDEAAVKSVYYPEVAEFVKRATGADKVLVFDHNVRSAPKAEKREDKARQPVRYVHNDYTIKSGPQRVRDLLEPAEAEARLENRFAVVNVWRPIRGPVQDMPLAFCDAESMRQDDFVPTDLIYENRTGEVYSVRHRPEHSWYYVSDMQPDEVILLKCYDSAEDGRARFTAHSAFQNPASPPDALARESIEVRTLVFFAPDN